MVASQDNFPLLAELLAEQQRLDTPVARFSLAHDADAPLAAFSPQLIPLTAPAPGEQYAFEVELDACTGCKACVAACHSLNGLDENETWRDVGLLVSADHRHPFAQTVTTACHHCADPACLNGCPVLAYEKDPRTGIVRHLDDQCIGCSYCILKCPYDVPKFNARLGIVRKCDLCHGRLAHGEAPACAQACPTHAIRIVTVPAKPPNAPTPAFLPAAPDPAYTQPTTRYVSKRPLPPDLVAGDAARPRPQPPHWPLIALLLLMPMAIGTGLADKILAPPTPALAVASWLAGASGLALSVLHLGQPKRAWRIFLGWRRSWLSREAIAFGAWLPLAGGFAATRLGWIAVSPAVGRALAIATGALGAVGLACSVMIYADTRRVFWRVAHTAPRFFGSAVLLGLASALCVRGTPRAAGFLLVAGTIVKLALEARALGPLRDPPDDPVTPARRSARLLAGPLGAVNAWRMVAGLVGGVALPLAFALGVAPAAAAGPAFLFTLLGELAERYLFFRAVDAPKMPGLPSA
jgi:Fe-S-cluster-containing dehydrogenase component/DMSO reductase anchor subunit